MKLAEAEDFRDESVELFALVNALAPVDFERRTQFKDWTVNDVLVHLHFWNLAVDLSLRDEAEFKARLADVAAAAAKGRLRAYENARVPLRGRELANNWIELVGNIASRWREIDAKRRLLWIGPSMSARSAMTARQMETWAHGFEVFDLFGAMRNETDRSRNIVVLGVNTFGWSHQVHGLPVPQKMPELALIAPSGAAWTFGEPGAGHISGAAVDFAAVVTQTRARKDTALSVEGDIAGAWMENAQCFAGPPETPPTPGSRHRQERPVNAP